jgi:hypothetical protein
VVERARVLLKSLLDVAVEIVFETHLKVLLLNFHQIYNNYFLFWFYLVFLWGWCELMFKFDYDYVQLRNHEFEIYWSD